MLRALLLSRVALVLATAGIAGVVAVPVRPALANDARDEPVSQRVANLMGALSHDSDFVRANAEKELFAMGPSAREELRRYTRDSDPKRAAAAQRLVASGRWGVRDYEPQPSYEPQRSPVWTPRPAEPLVIVVPAEPQRSGQIRPGDAPAIRLEESAGLGPGTWRAERRDDGAWRAADRRIETVPWTEPVRDDATWYTESVAAARREEERREAARRTSEEEIRRAREDVERRIAEMERRVLEAQAQAQAPAPATPAARSGQTRRGESVFAWQIGEDGRVRIVTSDGDGPDRVFEARSKQDLRALYPDVAARLDASDGTLPARRDAPEVPAVADAGRAGSWEESGFGVREPARRAAPEALRLGVTFETVPSVLRDQLDLPGHGLVIREVSGGSLAERLGLRENDVVLRLSGQEIGSAEDVRLALAQAREDVVTAEVIRKGRRETLRASVR